MSNYNINFVQVSGNKKIATKIYGSPNSTKTIVFLNGLLYHQERWKKTCSYFSGKNIRIITLDFHGQGLTAADNSSAKVPITLEQQADDLYEIVCHFNITSFTLAGLSYGGAVAQKFVVKYSKLVDKVLLIAPYIKPIPQFDGFLHQQSLWMAMLFPQLSKDDWYDVYLKESLKFELFKECVLLKSEYDHFHKHSEGIFRLSQGVKNLEINPLDFKDFENGTVSMFVPEHDEYIALRDYLSFWSAIPKDKRGEFEIAPAPHRVPDAKPKLLAEWIYEEVFGVRINF